MSDPSPSGETWVCRSRNAHSRCIGPISADRPGHSRCGPVPSSDTPSDERDEVCGSIGPRIGDEPERPRCAQPLDHDGQHQGFPGSGFEGVQWGAPIMRDEDFARTYRPAPSTPGDGTGRPGGWVEGIGWVALFHDLPEGTRFLSHSASEPPITSIVGVMCSPDDWENYPVIVTRWADGTTPAPPASPVPPTPTPCPYIVSGDEGTSYCSLAETCPAPPPTPVDGGERSQSEQWFVVHHNQIRSLRFGTFPIERLARASIAACTCGPHTLRHTVTTTYTASTTEEFVAAAADRGDRA